MRWANVALLLALCSDVLLSVVAKMAADQYWRVGRDTGVFIVLQ